MNGAPFVFGATRKNSKLILQDGLDRSADASEFSLLLSVEFHDLVLVELDVCLLVFGRDRVPAFCKPSPNLFFGSDQLPGRNVNAVTDLAFSRLGNRLIDQLHTARFASTIFLGTVLSETAPLEAMAVSKDVLFIEAHGVSSWRVALCNGSCPEKCMVSAKVPCVPKLDGMIVSKGYFEARLMP